MYVHTYIQTYVRTYVCTYAEVKQSDLIKVSMQGYLSNCCIAQQCCSHLLLAHSWSWCAALTCGYCELCLAWEQTRHSLLVSRVSPFLSWLHLKDFLCCHVQPISVLPLCVTYSGGNAITLSLFGQDLSPICLTYSLPVSRPWVQIFWPPGVPQLSWALV